MDAYSTDSGLRIQTNTDFLKLIDSLDLDGENKERKLLHLFQFSLTIKLATGLNVFQQDPRHIGGSYYSFPCSILSTRKDYKTPRTIDQSAGGKLHDRNIKEYWALLEDLALYNNESWNDPRNFAKPVKAISLPQDVPSTSDRHLIELENQVQRLMEAHLAPTQPT
ncbi:hypothetical protein Tco_1263707 [Tanacetum coccineum]